jgi:membrane protein insertase Oxa1/YidC/SpoIIIJ
VNGYYILTILAVVISFLSIWLSNKLMRDKNSPTPQKQSKTMYFVMPIIFGVFTFFYTSLFAVYIIVGQLVTMALTPLVTLIVKKWIEHDNNKQNKKNVVEVDYRRKEK